MNIRKQIFIFSLFLLGVGNSTFAKRVHLISNNSFSKDTLNSKVEIKKDTVFDIVETEPSFKGGKKALYKFLSKNISYPSSAERKGIQGKSIVSFIIDEKGKITQPFIIRSSGNKFLDEEALRVISIMPTWNAGYHKGEPVKVRYILPINFKLSNVTPVVVGTPKSLKGIWNKVEKQANGQTYRTEFYKFINDDGTFYIMSVVNSEIPMKILLKGKYKQLNDTQYLEEIYSDNGTLQFKNKIRYKILDSVVLFLNYKNKTTKKRVEETWVRVNLNVVK